MFKPEIDLTHSNLSKRYIFIDCDFKCANMYNCKGIDNDIQNKMP